MAITRMAERGMLPHRGDGIRTSTTDRHRQDYIANQNETATSIWPSRFGFTLSKPLSARRRQARIGESVDPHVPRLRRRHWAGVAAWCFHHISSVAAQAGCHTKRMISIHQLLKLRVSPELPCRIVLRAVAGWVERCGVAFSSAERYTLRAAGA